MLLFTFHIKNCSLSVQFSLGYSAVVVPKGYNQQYNYWKNIVA